MGNISRYDKPAESHVSNTFSPIPFDEMMKAGQIMAQQADQGANALQKVYDDTYNIKYIPGSRDEQYVKEQVLPATRKIFEKYISQDMGNPIIRRQAMRELSSNVDKNRIGKIQESWQGWAENQKWRQKLQAEGQYADYLDTPDTGYDTDTNGVYSKLIPAKQDFRKEAETYFNNLEPDSYITPGGEVKLTINNQKLQNTAKGNVQSFLDSTAGKQKLIEYRKRTGDTESAPEKVAYDYLLEVGKEKLMNRHAGFVPEYMTRGKDDSQYWKVEKTPVVALKERDINSSDFDIKSGVEKGGLPSFSPMGATLLDNKSQDRNKKYNYYNESLLANKEIKNLVGIMPKENQDQYAKLLDGKYKRENPEEYKKSIGEFYSKLQNTYKQIEQDLQEGSYLNAYYPDEISGIPESKLNNVDTQTKYMFRTNKLKELGSGIIQNREFIDPESGKVYNGKDFYDSVIKKESKANEDGLISVTGKYHYENPFTALTDNNNFGNSYQISVNGKQYVMSGSAGDYSDPLYKYNANANKSFSQVKYNPGVAIDEGDGTEKLYQDGIYYIKDKDSDQVIGKSRQFEDAYNAAREYYKNKK
jgi:hypothetical protein